MEHWPAFHDTETSHTTFLFNSFQYLSRNSSFHIRDMMKIYEMIGKINLDLLKINLWIQVTDYFALMKEIVCLP